MSPPILGLVAGAIWVAACASAPSEGRIVRPSGPYAVPAWSDAERQMEIAVRTLRVSDTQSVHLVRLAGAEKPHVHEDSDLTVVVLRGSVHMHFGDRVVPAEAGDVIEIPRGAPHWAENVAEAPSEAYVVFSPPSGAPKPPRETDAVAGER